MFKRREQFSKDRIVDPITGVPIPIVLNPKMEIADPQLPARERIAQYVRFIKEQNTSYCLFTPTGLKVSRVSGVSLASQIEAIAIDFHLEDESVIAQFERTYYLANLSSGFVVEESLISVDEFNANDLGANDVVALSSVQGAAEMGIRVIDARLMLTGRGVTRSHFFKREIQAFRGAGYRHPAQLRRLAMIMLSTLILSSSFYAYQQYQHQQRQLELERRAEVIPPKVGKDSAVEQLRTYAQWMRDHLAYYQQQGLQTLTLTSTEVAMTGLVKRNSVLDFYQSHTRQRVIPSYQLNVKANPMTGAIKFSDSTWQLSMALDREIPNVNQFGLERYENYLVTLQSALPRIKVAGVSQTPTLSSHGIKEGSLEIRGDFRSPKLLYDLANTFIGIPSYAESLTLTFNDQGPTQLDITMRLVGRG